MSDKKKLLEETQIRRMMTIAGIPALGETFMSNRYSRFTEEEEEEMPMEDPMAGEEAGEEAPMEDPMAGEEAPMGEPAGEAIPQDKVEAIVDAVLAGIQQETGVPLERVPGGEGEAPAGPPMEDPMAGEEPPMEDPMAGEEEDGMMEGGMKYKKEADDDKKDDDKSKKDDEDDDDLEEALKAAGVVLTKGGKSKLVNEVARRVARRLVRESKRRSK
jgi:hypothetical protein